MLIDELVSDLVTGTTERAERAGVQDYESVRRLDHRLAGFANIRETARRERFPARPCVFHRTLGFRAPQVPLR